MLADVLIVGGGLAGLTCAVALSGSNLRVVLVEAETGLGGRARSWTNSATGDPIAVGPHIILSEYPNLLHLLETLGTRNAITWDERQFITMVEGRREIRMKMSRLPAPFHFIPSLLADPTIRNWDWLSNTAVTLYALSLQEKEMLRLDGETAPSVLRRLGVSEAYIQRFWRFLSHAILNIPLEDCSAAAILRCYRRLIGRSGYQIGFASVGLGELFDAPGRRWIETHGGVTLLNTAVAALKGDRTRVAGAVLSDGNCIEAPFCVVSVPPQNLIPILRSEWMDDNSDFLNLTRLRPIPYFSVYLWFDRKLTHRRFWARTYCAEDLNCDFYDFSNIYEGGRTTSLIGSNIIDSDRVSNLTDEEIVRRTVDELAEYLPEASRAKLKHSVVNRIPLVIPRAGPGVESLRPSSETSIRGLLLAGDWCSTGLPCSMESACASGARAAEIILEHKGRPQKLVREHRELGVAAAIIGKGVRWTRKAAQRFEGLLAH